MKGLSMLMQSQSSLNHKLLRLVTINKTKMHRPTDFQLATKGLVMNKKIFIQILKTILFSVIGGALGSLITFYFMSR